jgi:hypothetical protein
MTLGRAEEIGGEAMNDPDRGEAFPMPEERDVPDIYCDGLQVLVSPFDLMLQLTERDPKVGPDGKVTSENRTVAYVRMSLEHAKVVAILLRRVLKNHEDQQGSPIGLHPQVCTELTISPREDWE